MPSFKIAYMKWREGGHAAAMSTPELQYLMVHYDAQLDTIAAYMQLARSFGYMILFIVAFPITPLLSYASNYVQLRVDAWKLVNMYQRVRPGGAQDIGTWQTVFAIMSGAAVVTNGALLVFTMDRFDALPGDAMYDKAWLFIVFQYVMFGLMFLLALLVDDVPEGVATQVERMHYLSEKLIDKVTDDDETVDKRKSWIAKQIEVADEDDPPIYLHDVHEMFQDLDAV